MCLTTCIIYHFTNEKWTGGLSRAQTVQYFHPTFRQKMFDVDVGRFARVKNTIFYAYFREKCWMKCLNGFKLSSNMKMMFDGCLAVCVHVGRFARMLGKDMLIRNNFRTKNVRIVPLHFDEEIAFWNNKNQSKFEARRQQWQRKEVDMKSKKRT